MVGASFGLISAISNLLLGLGAYAAEVFAQAVLNGVRSATSMGDRPAVRDWNKRQ